MPDPPKPPDEQYPPTACPHCAAHTAKPIRIATDRKDASLAHITMRCEDCQQSWIVPKLLHEDAPQ